MRRIMKAVTWSKILNVLILLFIRAYAVLQVNSPVFTPTDTYFVTSVTFSISCSTEGTAIHYTTDGSAPTLSSLSISNGGSIVWDVLGDTTFSARAFKAELVPSAVSQKQYIVLPRCMPPVFSPVPGNYLGHSSICMTSSTSDSMIYYAFNATDPTMLSPSVANGGCILLSNTGVFIIRSFAARSDFGSSVMVQAIYDILARTVNPVISPTTSVFLSLATLYFSCETPSCVIYFSIDSLATNASSVVVSGASITIDQIGFHTIYAFSSSPFMYDSEVIAKSIQILEPSFKPIIHPSQGEFINQVEVTIRSASDINATIIYTLDGSKPSQSMHVGVISRGIASFSLTKVGTNVINAVSIDHGKGESEVQPAIIKIVLSPYVEYPVLSSIFSPSPDISIHHIQTKINYQQVRGRYIVLRNPVMHFSFIPPLDGCESGIKTLPSVTGKAFRPSTSAVLRVDDNAMLNQLLAMKDDLQADYEKLQVKSCQIISNAGFFNTTTGKCLGDIVSQSELLQTSDKKTVNFGIRNGKYVTGYIPNNEIVMKQVGGISNFDTLISGYIWLVRDGSVYVTESSLEEDDAFQTTGSSFLTVKSARTAIGHNFNGELIIVQIEGETWVSGLGLIDFANLLVELNVMNAINLDGGGSATMSQNDSMIGDPSWLCDGSDNLDDLFRCEKPVLSAMCIYASKLMRILHNGKIIEIEDDDDADDYFADDDLIPVECRNSTNSTIYNSMLQKYSLLQEKNSELRSMLIVVVVLLVLSIFCQLWPKVSLRLKKKGDIHSHFQPSALEMVSTLTHRHQPLATDEIKADEALSNGDQQYHDDQMDGEQTSNGVDNQLDDDLDRFYLEPTARSVSVRQSWMATKKKLYSPLRNVS